MYGMQSSPNLLTVLFVAVSVFLPAIHALTVSGDYVCSYSENHCEGALLNIPSGSNFSLKCKGYRSCEFSHIVVHSGSTLRPGGIDFTDDESCVDSTLVIYDSNLATDANNYLHCGDSGPDSGFDACDRMNLTLVDSSIALYCESNNCWGMEVHLFRSSTLELKQGSDIHYSLTIYLHDSSAQLIDNGVSGYTLVIASTTSIPTTTPTPTTSTPRLSSTTTPTTSIIPTPTAVASTRVYTTNEDGGNGGSNAGSNVIMIAAIGGGGVGVLLLVCGFYLGVKYSGSRKQEQDENQKDEKVQIALVPSKQSKCSGQLSESSDNPERDPKWVVAAETDKRTTEGRMSDADSDAVSSRDLSSEMMYMDMPKDYTPGGHLPQAPEGCQRQVEGGAYGIR